MIQLRDVREKDLPILFEHQLDPIANRIAAFEPRNEPEFMAHWREKILADKSVVKKAILVDERVVGNIVSFERAGKREIGYWIDREHWGRGIATEALRQLLVEVTQRPLYAFVAKQNVGSIRVLEKCGFTVVGEGRGSAGERAPEVEELLMRLDAAEARPDSSEESRR